MNSCPLVVNLDGVLVHTNILHEFVLKFFTKYPLGVFWFLFWLFKGQLCLKKKLISCIDFDPAHLPYNGELLGWLKQQKDQGRKLVLCTNIDRSIAIPIADHLAFFDEIISSDGNRNLAGDRRAITLEHAFGPHGFDYVGNSKMDLRVWKRARRAIVTSDSKALFKKTERVCQIERVVAPNPMNFKIVVRMLRVHQWLKNLLLFIPLLAAHQINETSDWVLLFIAFLSFCFCASSIYITNDLLDLESDRLHPRKITRPFASGHAAIWVGVVMVPMLLLASFCLGYFVGKSFLMWLVFYFVLTWTYSWGLKRLVLIDCLVLAMAYTLRIVAGSAAVEIKLSFWMLAFSVFLFLSLSFLKRYAELLTLSLLPLEKAHGRCYYRADAPLIQILGIASGYAAVLVLSLYLNSEKVMMLYKVPELIWVAFPIVLYWISWMWLQAHRGLMYDDPLLFALKDKVSLFAGFLFALTLMISAIGLPW